MSTWHRPCSGSARNESKETTMTKDEKEIRGVLAEFVTAIRNKDAEAMIAPLADDEVAFDLAPPLRMAPEQTHDPSRLEQWFATWQGPIRSEPHDLTVAVGGDVAY